MSRTYIPCWDRIGISKARYLELLNFCRQYPEWKHAASSMIGIRGKGMDGMPHGTGVGDPVAAQAERRARLLEKIGIVDSCLCQVRDGEWAEALMRNVCHRVAYEKLPRELMPTSHMHTFFQARREFFILLNEVVK